MSNHEEPRKSIVPRRPPVELLQIRDDQQLGFDLWNWWRALVTEVKGISLEEVTEDEFELITKDTLALDTDSPYSVGLEKALKRAAAGQFADAGRLWRKDSDRGANHLAAIAAAQNEHETRMRGPHAGGKKRAKDSKEEAADRNKLIITTRDQLRSAGTAERDIASKLARRTWQGKRLSVRQIRDILKKAADR